MTMCRKEVEISFSQRIREVEDQFSFDQESAAERFQAEMFKLEQHYQSELTTLSESHAMQKLRWEAEAWKVVEGAEEQRKSVEEAVEQEKERCNQEWENERQELENVHSEETEALKMENKQLQNDLEDVLIRAQRKEIELSMQLNELHSRFQEKHQLLAQTEDRFFQADLQLNQTVEDFKQERAELLISNSELQEKYDEMLSISERQVAERIQLLAERDDLRVKVEELETLLKQAALDFELERKEMLENLVVLEKKLRDTQEVEVKALRAEKDDLKIQIQELQVDQEQVGSSTNGIKGNESNAFIKKQANESSPGPSDQDEDLLESLSGLGSTHTDPDLDDGDFAPIADQTDEQDGQDEASENQDLQPGDSVITKGCDPADQERRDPNHDQGELDSQSPDCYLYVENKSEAVPHEIQSEDFTPLQAFAGREDKEATDSCSRETRPQEDHGNRLHEQHHETVVEETADDPAQDSNRFPNGSPNQRERDLPLDGDCEHGNRDTSAHDGAETMNEVSHCENQECATLELQALCDTATEENLLLHQKIALLQQKTEILESLLAHHSEKFKTSRRALEENYKLKVQILMLMEHVKELQVKSLKLAELQIRYEDCLCENAKLKDQNDALEKQVWSLESRLDVFHDFGAQHSSLVEEIGRMRAENAGLFHLLSDLERQDELSDSASDTDQEERPGDEAFPNLLDQTEEKLPEGVADEECCREVEEQNGELRRAIAELQDESQIINETTLAHR